MLPDSHIPALPQNAFRQWLAESPMVFIRGPADLPDKGAYPAHEIGLPGLFPDGRGGGVSEKQKMVVAA